MEIHGAHGVNDKKSCARDGHDIQKNQSTDLSLECDGYKKKGMRDYVRTCVDVLVYGRRDLGCDDHAEAVCSRRELTQPTRLIVFDNLIFLHARGHPMHTCVMLKGSHRKSFNV